MERPSLLRTIAALSRAFSHGWLSIWYRLDLCKRLFIIFLLAILLPLTVLYFTYHHSFEAYAIERVEHTLMQVVAAQKRRIDMEIRQLDEYFALLASRTQLRRSLAAYNQTHQAQHLVLLNAILQDAQESLNSLMGLWIRDINGQIIAGAARDDLLSPVIPSTTEGNLQFYWQRQDNSPEPGIWLNGLLTLDTVTIGSLHILMRADVLYQVLDDFCCERFAGHSVMLIYDASGTPTAVRGPKGQADFVDTLWFDKLINKVAFQHDPTRPPRIAEYTAEGTPVLYARQRLNRIPADVMVYTELLHLTAALRAQRHILSADIAVSILLALVFSLSIARTVSRPIHRLTQATRRLGAGELDVQVREHPWGEFAVLTRGFNQTVQALRQRIDAHQRAQQALHDLANTDGLTRLTNRRYFMELLTKQVSHCQPNRPCGALLYLDLDQFKPINDQYGHEFGDGVLRIAAERLQRLVRSQDAVGRLGGDEFAILLTDTAPGFEPETIAHRVEEALNLPMVIKTQPLQVGCSVGWAPITAGSQPQDILNAADEAMYRVKMARRVSVSRRI